MQNFVKLTFKKQLKLFLLTIRRTNHFLIISLFIAVIILLNYECKWILLFWENKTTKGLSAVGVQILYAYVTGLIFYLFMEHSMRHKRKAAIYRYVLNNEHKIKDRIQNILMMEIVAFGKTKEGIYKVDFKGFANQCKQIKIHHTQVAVWIYPETLKFRDFVLKIGEDIRGAINEILAHSELFDEMWLNSLSNMSDSNNHLISHLDVGGNEGTLSLVAGDIWNLYAESQKFERYVNTYYKSYKKVNEIINPVGTYIPKELEYEMEIINPDIRHYLLRRDKSK